MSEPVLKIFEEYRGLLASHGLDTFDALFAFDGGRYIDGHRDRSVVRLELAAGDGRPVVLYLKREWHPKAAMLVRRMLGRWLRPPMSRSRRECRNLVALARRGIAAAEPVAVGEERRGMFYRRALLLLREVPDAVSLGTYLRAFPREPAAADLAAKRAMVREVADLVRRMHDRGLAFRDLFAKHVYVSAPASAEGTWRPTLIDAQRALRFPHLWPHARWHDLAALMVTTQHPACTATDRLRFLLAYARQSRLTASVKLMAARVAKRAETLRGKGADPQLADAFLRGAPGMTPLGQEDFRHVDRHRIFANSRYLAELRRLGLDTMDAVMDFAGGQRYRDVPDRLTVRIPMTDPDGQPAAVYLKRHRCVDTAAWLEGLLKWRKARTRADVECRNIFLLAHFGIASMKPVALGQVHRWTPRQPSFLMTEEIAGGVPADDYLRAHFAPGAPGAGDATRKRRLVRQIAQLARRFHRSGFYHRDLYLCHVFVRELTGKGDAETEWALHLIDLQRVRWPGPGKVGRRWIVKDLAELDYSAPAGAVTRTDKMRFLRAYLALGSRREGGRLGCDAQRLVGSVRRKSSRIARHDARRRTCTAE